MIWKSLTREHLEETKKHFSSGGYVNQWYAMAMEIVLTTLGPEWWKMNCSLYSATPTPFLKTNDSTEFGHYEHQDRIIWLGHILFALKESTGFDIFIDKLKKRDFESAFLNFGLHLFSKKIFWI